MHDLRSKVKVETIYCAVLSPRFGCIPLCPFEFGNQLAEEETAGKFILVVCCCCCLYLPRGAMNWSAIYGSGLTLNDDTDIKALIGESVPDVIPRLGSP